MRRPSESVAARNEAVLRRLRELKADHPFWGYRHCWAHLRYVDKLEVNKKRVYRLLKEHGLLATQTRHAVPRTSTRAKPKPDRPNQWWGIDMTKVMTQSGWAYVVLVLDWYSKKVVGHHCGRTATADEWLAALDRGTERMMRTLKEELLWLRERRDPYEASATLGVWIERYNESYLHSALKYKTPNQQEETYNLTMRTLLEIAC